MNYNTILPPFKWFVLENFPYIEDDFDALTNWQLFCKLGKEMNKIIEKCNLTGEQVENLTNAFNTLKAYVDDYFENLDVTDEINAKLDEMAQSGELQELLDRQYQELKTEVNQTIANNNIVVNNRITTFENNTNNEINNFKGDINDVIEIQNQKINGLHGFEPIVVNSSDDMTDTTRIYLLTTDNKWYYYNGTQWTVGGDYNTTAIQDGSIDFLKFDTTLQDTFDLDFAEKIPIPNDLFQGYCYNNSGTLGITQNAGYRYCVLNLDNNAIYNFVGRDNLSCKALVIADPNDSNAVIFATTSGEQINNILFKINQSGLKAYISWYYTAIGDTTEVAITTQPQGFLISKLNLIKSKVVINNNADLVATYEGFTSQQASTDLNQIFKIRTGSSAEYTMYQYRLQKGKTYKITYSKYYLSNGLVITDDKFYCKYFGTSSSQTTIDYTATFNGFIFLIKNPFCTPSIEVINDNLEIPNNGIYQILEGKTIVYDGDSITESRTAGTHQNGGAYPKLIADLTNSSYTNNAVGGATLSYKSGQTSHVISRSLSSLPTNGNAYVFSGGINDMWDNRPLGTLTSDYTTAVDDTTVIGALEQIFRYALTNFLGKPIIFVITHKVAQPYTNNSEGYNQFDLHDAIVSVCKKYSIPYYDAFDESGLNGWNTAQSDEFLNANQQQQGDGTHPNATGYNKYYVPQIIEILNKNLLK